MVEFENPWLIDQEAGTAILRFSANALAKLGQLYFLDLPNLGAQLKVGMPSIGIEAERWIGASKVPIDGTVIAVNEAVSAMNSDHLTSNDWILKLAVV